MDNHELYNIVVGTALIVIVIVNNSMAILAAWLSRGKQSITSKRLILSLNISDLLVGLSGMYYLIATYAYENVTNDFFNFLRNFLLKCSLSASMHNILTIAIDRYIVITYPLLYAQYMTKKTIVTMVYITWMVAFLISVTNYVLMAIAKCKVPHKYCHDNNLAFYTIISMQLYHFMTWIFMLVLYYRIWIKARECTQRLKARMKETGLEDDDVNHNKANKVILTILIWCALCWLPSWIAIIFTLLSGKNISLNDTMSVTLVTIFKSAVNPLIYAWMCPTYREAFHRILKCGRK